MSAVFILEESVQKEILFPCGMSVADTERGKYFVSRKTCGGNRLRSVIDFAKNVGLQK